MNVARRFPGRLQEDDLRTTRANWSGLYDDEAAAEYLGTTTRHLQRLRERRELPFVRVGRKIRYKQGDLDAYIEHQRVESIG